MKYIREDKEESRFYQSYGSFMHKLIERYYKGELTKEEMQTKFLFDFSNEVLGERPQELTVQKYIRSGIKYLREFQPFPYNPLAVEKKFEFSIRGFPFVGFVDYIGERDRELYIVDNKSRDLKPRSKRKQPTKSDIELDEMLRQLYLYSEAVRAEYGKLPKALCFNCFKENLLIEEPFREDAFIEALDWAENGIKKIRDTGYFYPAVDYFGCKFICGFSDECCYWEMR